MPVFKMTNNLNILWDCIFTYYDFYELSVQRFIGWWMSYNDTNCFTMNCWVANFYKKNVCIYFELSKSSLWVIWLSVKMIIILNNSFKLYIK
jgi:hypothetical protein